MLLESVPEEPGEPKKPGELRGPAEKIRVHKAENFEKQLPDAWNLRPSLVSLFEDAEQQRLSEENPFQKDIFGVGSFHYRFVRLHPFCDGNGRMARALSTLLLAKEDAEVLLFEKPVNSVILDHIEDYIDVLKYCDYIYVDLKDEGFTEDEKLALCEVPFTFFYAHAVLRAWDEHLVRKSRELYEAGHKDEKPLEPMPRELFDLSLAEMQRIHPWDENIKEGHVERIKSERSSD